MKWRKDLYMVRKQCNYNDYQSKTKKDNELNNSKYIYIYYQKPIIATGKKKYRMKYQEASSSIIGYLKGGVPEVKTPNSKHHLFKTICKVFLLVT